MDPFYGTGQVSFAHKIHLSHSNFYRKHSVFFARVNGPSVSVPGNKTLVCLDSKIEYQLFTKLFSYLCRATQWIFTTLMLPV